MQDAENQQRPRYTSTFEDFPGSVSMGHLRQDIERVDSIIRKADSVFVRDGMEKIGNSDCYVIEAKARTGDYTVWIDPAHSYNIAKAEVRKGPGDVLANNYVLPENDNIFVFLKNTRFKKIGDLWVPIEADVGMTRNLPSGKSDIQTSHYKITEITLNPDHDKLGSFVPDDIPNGARVRIFKGNSLDAIPIRYTWQDGQVVDEKGRVIIDCRPDELNRPAEPKPKSSSPNSGSPLDLLRKYQTIQAKSDKLPSQERIVHFPSDRSLGQLRIQDAGSVRQLNYWFYWTDTGEPALEYLCEAQGDVRVPAGKRLYLAVNGTTSRNLSALSKLKPDDVYGITLSALPKDPVEPGDECMPHIAHLTGLKSLSAAHITDKGLEFISNFKSLEYLHLCNRVTDRGMAYVAELPLLRGLYIEAMDSRITDAGLQHISKATSLEELALWGERMGDAGLIHLRGLPRLKYLFLRGPHFTDAGCAHLKDIPSLKILSYHEGVARITDAGLVHIADIPNLESLCLHGMRNITDDGIAHLSKMRSLKKLEIGSSQVTDRGLGYLLQIKTLERLELPQDQKGITDTGLAYLAQLTNLRHLEISRIHYIDPKMNKEYYTDKGLAELAKCRLLEEIGIGSVGVTDAGMEHVAKLTNLKRLQLFGCDNVTDKGLAKLAGLKFLTSLQVADLNLTISGLNQLKSLPNLTMLCVYDLRRGSAILDLSGLNNLEDLMLSFAPRSGEVFTDDDLVCLANLKRLNNLQIGPSDFTDKGMTSLAGLTNMERLVIGGPSLTDKGLESLTGMKKLYLLTISGSFDEGKMAFSSGGKITDQGLRFLEGLKQLQNLEINSDTAFSAAAIRRLQDALPNLYSLRINDGSAPARNRPTQQRAPATGQPRTERPRVNR